MTQHRERLLRDFWHKEPEVWFIQTELNFRVNRITDEREKFEHALDAMTLLPANISDLVKRPPTDNAYTILKSRVLAHKLTPVKKAVEPQVTKKPVVPQLPKKPVMPQMSEAGWRPKMPVMT